MIKLINEKWDFYNDDNQSAEILATNGAIITIERFDRNTNEELITREQMQELAEIISKVPDMVKLTFKVNQLQYEPSHYEYSHLIEIDPENLVKDSSKIIGQCETYFDIDEVKPNKGQYCYVNYNRDDSSSGVEYVGDDLFNSRIFSKPTKFKYWQPVIK